MSVTWMDVSPSPIALRDLLRAHKMLPDTLEDPIQLIRYSQNSRVGFAGSSEDPIAVFIESDLDNKVLCVQVILKDKDIHREHPILGIREALVDRWFHHSDCRRVECRIECNRTHSIKFMKAIGFRQETAPSGIREAYACDNRLINIHVLGLLPTDHLRPLKLQHTALTNTMETEVEHAV